MHEDADALDADAAETIEGYFSRSGLYKKQKIRIAAVQMNKMQETSMSTMAVLQFLVILLEKRSKRSMIPRIHTKR